jgi:protein gp37
MNKTKIEYLTHTSNPLAMRCIPVSEGCANCWHLAMARRLSENPQIPPAERKAYKGGSPVLRTRELEALLHAKQPARIGIQYMGDLFCENVPFGLVREVFEVMERTPQHTYLLLTKRARQMLAFMEWLQGSCGSWLLELPNVWLGVSAENQKAADERIPILLQTPAAVRFVSVEPCLSAVDLTQWLARWHCATCDANLGQRICTVCGSEGHSLTALDWIIAGSESGPKRRRAEGEWFRSLRDQCQSVGMPFFLKQMAVDGKLVKMPELDGRLWEQYPTTEA